MFDQKARRATQNQASTVDRQVDTPPMRTHCARAPLYGQ